MHRFVTIILLLTLSFLAKGQSGLCDSITPFYVANLSGNPGGTWFSPPDIREGNCCTSNFPARCIEFEVTLDVNSVGIIFDIFSGASPSGSLFYQVNCGPEIPVGEMICLNGPGPHTITFCKPGSNQNVYSIQSIPGIVQTLSTSTIEGCEISVYVDGLEDSTIVWHEISSGTGLYDPLFTCLSACDTTIFQAGSNLPGFIEVEVCGHLQPTICDLSTAYKCDTITITIADPLTISFIPDTFISCASSPFPILAPTITGGTGDFIYQWFDNVDGTGNLISTDSSYTATFNGNYSVIVYDSLFPTCSIDTANAFVEIIPNLNINYTGDSVVCFGDSLNLSASAGTGQLFWYQNGILICSNCSSLIIPPVSSLDTFQIIANDAFFCSDTLIFNIAVLPTFSDTLFDTICANQSYTLPGGTTISATGSYVDTLQTLTGCDSIITTNLSVLPSSESFTFDTICANETYVLPNGSSTNVAAIYIDSFTNIFGCDSTITTNLVVLPAFEQMVNASICANESYTLPGGTVTSSAGTYTDSLLTSSGCDSVITTNLSVFPSYNLTINDTICANEMYTLPGGTFTSSAGTYVDTLSTINACDSIITTNLTIAPIFSVALFDTICSNESYVLPTGIATNITGIYVDSFATTSGCDSIITTNLIVLPAFEQMVNASICANESYTLPGGTVTSSAGTYTDSLSTSSGCDSVITTNLSVFPSYNLTINATICTNETYTLPGGSFTSTAGTYVDTLLTINACDSIITTNLTIAPIFSVALFDTICSNESYVLPSGIATNTSGIYVDSFATTFGCDSIITTNLFVLPAFEQMVNATICSNESYTLPGGTVTSSAGTYTDSLLTSSGCDSVITTNLTVFPSYTLTINATICTNETYTLPGGTFTSSAGTYVDTLLTINACDSIITTNLTIAPIFSVALFDTICSNESYVLPSGIATNITGIYVDSFATTSGCDSIITTNLFVLPAFEQMVNASICANESYTLPGGTVTSSAGTYTDSLSTSSGCDSVITTNLTVLPSYDLTINATICTNETYTLPGGAVVSSSGIYIDNLNSAFGCDSIITTNLTVLLTEFSENVVLCFEEPYLLPSGVIINTAGTYTSRLISSFGCDSIITSTVSYLPQAFTSISTTICEGEAVSIGSSIYTNSGNYLDTLTNQMGCDSIVELQLTVNPLSLLEIDTTLCAGTGIELFGVWYDKAGTFEIHNTGIWGCDSLIIIHIDFYSDIFIDAGEDFTIQAGELFTIQSSGFDLSIAQDFGWIYDQDAVCTNCTYYESTGDNKLMTFTAYVSDTNNCFYSDEVNILIKEACPDEYLEVPNIISPNQDGANDEFYIKNPYLLDIEYYRIYNRWGELVYETYNWSEKWNGEFRDKMTNPNVFSYYIKGSCLNNESFIKVGNITVLK